ncbi:MAG TPA: Txe/YoeB family addiction module toxin [Verrucomicrobiales bacterium]|nr:Txe/YoeB family addiction module toxin [Verrucomicrobiales bacterium]HIL71355.1 Txe/YoeB family addiction module toxin [Verrucomicrobiota bacterium]
MRLMWLPGGWADYLYWQENNPKVLARVNELIRDTLRNPFSGIGKPEPLKSNLKGWWSRRITKEHRLVYRVEDEIIIIMQCRFHYSS